MDWKRAAEVEMQAIARQVGYSETAFIAPTTGFNRTVRYYSPEIEVTFCGHATIAAGVALGSIEGTGTYTFTTIQLVWRETDHVFHSRNPFPVGGVIEDPATGAAAAALGGYLREKRLVQVPARIRIHQGVAMGRPSRLEVEIPEKGGIAVSGTAVKISD